MSVGRHFSGHLDQILPKAAQINIRWLTATSSWDFGVFNDADSITFLSSCSRFWLLVWRHAFPHKNFSLLPLSYLCTLWDGSGSIFCIPSHWILRDRGKVSLSFIFLKLSKPNTLSSYPLCSNSLIPLASTVLTPVCQCFTSTGVSKTERQMWSYNYQNTQSYLPLLNLTRFSSAHFSYLSRNLWIAAVTSSIS